jgi:hypothetical protein
MSELFIKNDNTKVSPEYAGWYNTDKGELYWHSKESEWSCREEYVSEEYPKYWYSIASPDQASADNVKGEKSVTIMDLLNKYSTTSVDWLSHYYPGLPNLIDPMDYHKIAEEYAQSRPEKDKKIIEKGGEELREELIKYIQWVIKERRAPSSPDIAISEFITDEYLKSRKDK